MVWTHQIELYRPIIGLYSPFLGGDIIFKSQKNL